MPVELVDDSAFIELCFKPSAHLIQSARGFVGDFYQKVFADREPIERIAIATHELLENGAKYALDGVTRLRIDVVVQDTANVVQISSSNRASTQHHEALSKTFEEMKRYEDMTQYYLAQLRRTAKQTEGSGLGLARIRAEADMTITYERIGDIALIRAEAQVSRVVTMTPAEAINVAAPTYQLEANLDGDHWNVRLSGNADTRAVLDLDRFLKRLHVEVQRIKTREVIVDLEALEFMNSSCFKAFITWLSELIDLPRAERYAVRFRPARNSYWQRRGLEALKGFAPDVVEIEVEATDSALR